MSDPVLDAVTPTLHDRIAQLVAQHRLPGAAVGIVRDQELAWSAGFGFAEVATERRPDEHTLFRVGSITKTFTAAALLQLRAAGKLRLEDPLVRFLPEFAAVRTRFGTVEEVTLRRLLTHHSGLMGEPPLSHWETLDFPSIAEILTTLPQVEVVIEPDSAFKYSNLAFALLGEVVTRLSGRPYADYVSTEILEPLGMTASTFALTDTLRSRAATGYDPHPYEDEPRPSAHPLIKGMTAAGQLYSSVHDLSKWIALQFRTETQTRTGTQVLSGRSLQEMHRVYYLEPGWDFGYCLAWMAMRRGENVYLHHGGGIHGFLTMVSFNKCHRLGVIVLTNMTGHTATFEVTVEVLELLIAREKETTKTAPLPKPTPTPAEWKPFLGRYLGTLGDSVHIECRAGALLLTTPAFPLFPPARLDPTDHSHVFLVRDGRLAGERLTFRYAADGSVTGFTSGGFAFRRCPD